VFQRARSFVVARVLLATILGTGITASSVATALGHVNRQVGPYTILVVLVEEPTFEDNHAGFEFWVRRDQQPIVGLERTVKAEATGHGQRVALTVPSLGGLGFYVLDRTTDGVAFDPLGGGAWSLHLWGDIDGTPLDEQFAVTFPSYPRVAVAKPVAAANPATSVAAPWIALPALASLAAGLALVAFVAARRFRLRPGQPTPAPRR